MSSFELISLDKGDRVLRAPKKEDEGILQGGSKVYGDQPVIGSVTNLQALRDAKYQRMKDGDVIYSKSHTAQGDGGEGNFYLVTDSSPGTYADNNGTIIVPTGGDGSAAWLRELDGVINLRWFGAKGDGITNDRPAVLAAIRAATSIGIPCYAPAGRYLLSNPGTQISITDLTKDLVLYGDGPSTVFVRGDGIVTSSFARVFQFGNASGSKIRVGIRDFAIDGNARGNPMPVTIGSVSGAFQPGEKVSNGLYEYTVVTVSGDTLGIYEFTYTDAAGVFRGLQIGDSIVGLTSGATAVVTAASSSYLYQQSHSFAVNPTGIRGITEFTAEGIHIIDPTADGISAGGSAANTIGRIIQRAITQDTRWRQRSDICVTCCFDDLIVSDCAVDKFEIELNSYNESHAHTVLVCNVSCDVWLDMVFNNILASDKRPVVKGTNIVANGWLFLGDANFEFSSSSFRLAANARLHRGRYVFNGGEVYFGTNGDQFAYTRGVYSDGSHSPEKVEFNGTEFSANPLSTSLSSYFVDANIYAAGNQVYEFNDCKFRGSTVRSASLRSGRFAFNRCVHEYAGAAISYGDTSKGGVTNELHLSGNVVTHDSGLLLAAPTGGNELKIWADGNIHKHQKSLYSFTVARVMPPRGSGAVVNFVTADDYVMAASPTAGAFLKGQKVYFTAPDAGTAIGVQCTTTGSAGGSAVFKDLPSLPA